MPGDQGFTRGSGFSARNQEGVREPVSALGGLRRRGDTTRGEAISVTALVASIRDVLEHRFPVQTVAGEISNFILARSGHAYFVLKDANAQIRCVMFRSRTQYLQWRPKDGDHVEVRGTLTLYDARGDLQLNIDAMRRAGSGELYERFLAMRDRLAAEGLFDEALKREIPSHPRCIGVVTSPDGAALRDILHTLARRNPAIPVIVYPSPVQGASAAERLVHALRTAGRRKECDVILLARGGGSIEDLWSFNDETLAREIRACPIPVVSGVGHQTDFTIADFAADMRAPTPTAAAELVSPPRAAMLERVRELVERLSACTWRGLEQRMQRLDHVSRRIVHPRQRLLAQKAQVVHLRARLSATITRTLDARRWTLRSLAHRQSAALPAVESLVLRTVSLRDRLHAITLRRVEAPRARLAALELALGHLDPTRVLARGYSITTDAKGNVITGADAVEVGADVRVTLARGTLGARVVSKD